MKIFFFKKRNKLKYVMQMYFDPSLTCRFHHNNERADMKLASKIILLHPFVIEQDCRISPSSPVFTPMLVSLRNDWLQISKNLP